MRACVCSLTPPVCAGAAEEMPPMHGDHRERQGPAGGGGKQERVKPAGGDRPGAEPRGEQEGGRRTQEGEEEEEEEGETRQQGAAGWGRSGGRSQQVRDTAGREGPPNR